jgi:hypothetical protein
VIQVYQNYCLLIEKFFHGEPILFEALDMDLIPYQEIFIVLVIPFISRILFVQVFYQKYSLDPLAYPIALIRVTF